MRNKQREQASRCYDYCRLTFDVYSQTLEQRGVLRFQTNTQKLSLYHNTTSISHLGEAKLACEMITEQKAR
jgi:hypothetical protein